MNRQVITNWWKGDAVGLSPLFLLIWAVGDGLNLAGAFLTNQLPTQVRFDLFTTTMLLFLPLMLI